MTTPYIDLYNLIDDQTMQDRVKYALYYQAAYEVRLPATDQNVLNWARAILVDNFNPSLRQIMIRFVAQPNVAAAGSAIDDATLQATIAALQADLIAVASGRA